MGKRIEEYRENTNQKKTGKETRRNLHTDQTHSLKKMKSGRW